MGEKIYKRCLYQIVAFGEYLRIFEHTIFDAKIGYFNLFVVWRNTIFMIIY
jgi:hypothetical protein